MAYSMTAFSRAQNQVGENQLCWEIKSVNHRYLDVSFRLPEPFRFLETNLRSLLRDKIFRGKLECQLKFNTTDSHNQSMIINDGLVKSLLDSGLQMASNHGLANDMTVSRLLSWPGVIQFGSVDMEALGVQVEELFIEALNCLITVRLAEGNVLKKHVLSRLELLDAEVMQAQTEVAEASLVARAKLMDRLQKLQIEVPEARIEQEIALLLTRLDVSEELDRLHAHIIEVRQTLGSSEAIGRRLDFLMQELNREANTLSSKSDSFALTRHAVQMKVLIEQMREQIQNIE